jgi:peptide deformylase
MGHPVLRERAKAVEDFGPGLQALLQDMKDTMAAKNGAGLAAPQIGVSQRVVIFGVQKNPRYPDAEEVPFTVLVNPRITVLTREVEEGWEGCLSVPGMRGVVPRYVRLRYSGFDEAGRPFEREAEGFHARCPTRGRPPGRHPVPHAHDRHEPLRLQRGALSRRGHPR